MARRRKKQRGKPVKLTWSDAKGMVDRKRLGYSQEEIAKDFGWSQSTLSRRWSEIEALAERFAPTPKPLVEVKPPPEKHSYPERMHDPQEATLPATSLTCPYEAIALLTALHAQGKLETGVSKRVSDLFSEDTPSTERSLLTACKHVGIYAPAAPALQRAA